MSENVLVSQSSDDLATPVGGCAPGPPRILGAPHRRLRVAVCTAFLAAAGLAACASDGATPDTATGAGTARAASTSAAGAPSPTASAAPAGTQWAEATGSRVRFAVADTWTVNDLAKVIAQGDAAAIKQIGEALGIPPDKFETLAKNIDLYVMGPAKNGYSPNITVTPNSLTRLPSEAAVASEVSSIGATVGTATTRRTPLGDAIVLPYTLPIGAFTVAGRAIVAKTPTGFATITVSHVSGEEADALTEQVLASLGAL